MPDAAQGDRGRQVTTEASTRRSGLTLCVLLAVGLAFAVYRQATTVPYPTTDRPSFAAITTPLKIDPNTAPWWELTALPGVGEVTAKKIVAYRETRRSEQGRSADDPVFHSAADLQRVKGIGPKKSERMAEFLLFDAGGEPRRRGDTEATTEN